MTAKAKVLNFGTFTAKSGRLCGTVTVQEEDGTTYNLVMFDDRVSKKPPVVGGFVTVKTAMDFRGSGSIQLVY